MSHNKKQVEFTKSKSKAKRNYKKLQPITKAPPVEIEKIIEHVLAPGGKSATYHIQWQGENPPPNSWESSDIFWDTPSRERIFYVYLTDTFTKEKAKEIHAYAVGFAHKTRKPKKKPESVLDDIIPPSESEEDNQNQTVPEGEFEAEEEKK